MAKSRRIADLGLLLTGSLLAPLLRLLSPIVARRMFTDATLDQVVDFNRRLVRAFAQAGIPVVPGTDTIIPGIVPGVALHEELAALVAAGMGTEQTLAAATRLSAEWLGVAEDRGTIEVGKRADLLLLEADPRADIANTRKIAAVFAGGRHLPRAELETMLAKLAERYEAMPAPYGAVSGEHAQATGHR